MNKSTVVSLLTLSLSLSLLASCASVPELHSLLGLESNSEEERGNEIVNIASLNDEQAQQAAKMQDSIDDFGAIVRPNIYSSVNGAYKSRPLAKHIGDYVKNMTQDLVSNMEYVSERTPIAVTTFSFIDGTLKQSNLLGHQMAESFMHELHKYRIPVIEYKATQFISVTESGDYFLSRDFMELGNSTPVQYVLTGTMTKHQGGYIVNSRILGMESKVVVASAQMFVPFYIVDALIPSESSRPTELVDGVRLIQGDE